MDEMEARGINSQGIYSVGFDPRYDPQFTYIIPKEEYEDEYRNYAGEPSPVSVEDVLVDMTSEDFLSKNRGKVVYMTSQLRLDYETNKVYGCVYMPEFKL